MINQHYLSMLGNKSVIRELSEYATARGKEIGYEIPPMTPFVGENFNVTKAGIHADGLMKDQEIYNIFDTEKILNRAPGVSVSKTSGAAGIAYWINEHFHLKDEDKYTKDSPLVVKLKEWVDMIYEGGRTTVLSTGEIEQKILEITDINERKGKLSINTEDNTEKTFVRTDLWGIH